MSTLTITESPQNRRLILKKREEIRNLAEEMFQVIEHQQQTINTLKNPILRVEGFLNAQGAQALNRLKGRTLSSNREEAKSGTYVSQLSSLVHRYHSSARSRDDYKERVLGFTDKTPLKNYPKVPNPPKIANFEPTNPLDKCTWNFTKCEIEIKFLKEKETFYRGLPMQVKDLQSQVTLLEKDRDFSKERAVTEHSY